MDFTIMKALAGWLESVRLPMLRSLPLKETVSQFSASMGAQADLRVEAAHLERFHNAFASRIQVLDFA
jgi:aarF domain-containing kinase